MPDRRSNAAPPCIPAIPTSSHPVLVPRSIRVCADPVVTTTAFEAFVCTPKFDESGSRFLETDVSIDCADHVVRMWAWIALLLYPIGLWIVFATLLGMTHHSVVGGRPTALSKSLLFLSQPYRRTYATYWWELAEVSSLCPHASSTLAPAL